MPRLAPVAALAAALLSAGCSVFGGRSAPEPDDTVISEPPFEIRAVSRADGGPHRGRGRPRRGGAHRVRPALRLYQRDNAPAEDIAMTAPVTSRSPPAEKIAMTAPVLTEEEAGRWQVMFVLPDGMSAETAPRPTDPAVEIATIPARRVAVVTFSGHSRRPGTSRGTGRV